MGEATIQFFKKDYENDYSLLENGMKKILSTGFFVVLALEVE